MNYLRNRRESLGKTRKELAEEVGITINLVCLIETNKRRIADKYKTAYAKALNLSEEELDRKYGKSFKRQKEKERLSREIETIDKEIKDFETQISLLKEDRKNCVVKLAILEREGENE